MALPGFLYGGNTGETPQSLAKKRAVVEALLMGRGAPKTVGEGLLALGDGIAANVLGRRADAAERQGNESATAAIAALLAGSEFPPAPAASTPIPEPALSSAAQDFVASNPQPGGFGDSIEAAAADPNSALAFTGVAQAGKGWTELLGPDGNVIRREGARNWRNNNPGNLEYGDFAKSAGAIGTDGRFAVFPTYEAGRAAKAKLLFESPSYRDKTILGAINRYAPPFENDTNAYAGAVAEAVGVDLNTPISSLNPQQRQTMLDAMERVEGFKVGKETRLGGQGAAPTQVASLDPTAGANQALTNQPQSPGNLPLANQPVAAQRMAQAQPQTMTDALPEMAGNAPAQVGGPSLQQLIQAAQNPWLSDSQRAVVNTMLEQRMQQQDPMRQLQLRKLQMEIDNAGKPERPWWVRPDGSVDPAYIAAQQAGRAETNVTVGGGKYGTIPQGFMLQENGPQGAQLVPIPGGPAAMEAEAAARAEENRRSGQVERSGLVAEEIDRALGVMDTGILPDTGIGALLSGMPGTDAKSLSARLDTIKANIGFEELNKMRQESPTGGALGQVTERELAFLQSVAGSLDQAQSDEDLRYNLNRLWNAYMETIHGPGNFTPRELGKAPANAKGNRTSSGVEWSID